VVSDYYYTTVRTKSQYKNFTETKKLHRNKIKLLTNMFLRSIMFTETNKTTAEMQRVLSSW